MQRHAIALHTNELDSSVVEIEPIAAVKESIQIPHKDDHYIFILQQQGMFRTLPCFLERDLHFGNFIIGIVMGLQSLATLATRAWSGKMTDARGAATSKNTGVVLVLCAGLSAILLQNFAVLSYLLGQYE